MLLRPQKKTKKRLREVLNQLYAHLDSSAYSGSLGDVSILSTNETFYEINVTHLSDNLSFHPQIV